jgi:DNA polymerase-4
VVVPPGGELAFLHPLPVRALWGVGPKTQQVLDRLGTKTVGDLALFEERALITALGQASGRHLHRLAHAVDDRPVVPDLKPKSISHEETFARDHTTLDTLRVEAVRMAEAVAQRLRRHGYAGRTVTVKVRFHDFRTITRSITLPAAVDAGPEVARAAKLLLEAVDPASGVRLLGVGVTNLDDDGAVQLTLEDGAAAGWHDATTAVDAIRDRFGDDAIKPGTLAGRAVKQPGDTQWGPTQAG